MLFWARCLDSAINQGVSLVVQGSALVVMGTRAGAAAAATMSHGDTANPLLVVPFLKVCHCRQNHLERLCCNTLCGPAACYLLNLLRTYLHILEGAGLTLAMSIYSFLVKLCMTPGAHPNAGACGAASQWRGSRAGTAVSSRGA
jgi:hypothetical protein